MATAADKTTLSPNLNHPTTQTTARGQRAATAAYTASTIAAAGGAGRPR